MSITEQGEDNPTGRLLEGIIESVDEFYSENPVQEVTRGVSEAASRGLWMTTFPPYGYRRFQVHDGTKKRPRLALDPPNDGVVRRIARMMRSRAPQKVNPGRIPSPYLLSGLAKCQTCGKAMTAAEAKSGKYTYYICHSLLTRGKGTCKTPRLNAKNFEKIIVDELRANVLTESNIRDLVKIVDEEMDGVASEQRDRLEDSEGELADVKGRLARVWNAIETTDIEMPQASERIKEHWERKERLEAAAEEARELLKDRRQFPDSAETIATFAE